MRAMFAMVLAAVVVVCGCNQQAPVSAPTGFASPAVVQHGRHESKDVGEVAPGQFDYFLLTLSWSPEFCASARNAGTAECAAHSGFLVHGLWPQDNNGQYPSDCGNASGPTDLSALSGIMPASLMAHEWPKHGTCSGLGPAAYVAAIARAYGEVKLPPAINNLTTPTRMVPADALSLFAAANPTFPAGAFALSCANNRLSAVEICMDKSLKPMACQAVHTCGATQIGVTPRAQ